MERVSAALRGLAGTSPFRPKPVEKSSSQDLLHIQQKIRPGHQPNIPEKLAALYYVWSFGLGIYAWLAAFWLCNRFPLLWPVLLVYTVYIWTWGAEASRNGDWPTPFKNWILWRWLAAYFPARIHKTADLPPGKPYIFAHHPHGILSFSAWLTFASSALGFDELFPGVDCRILTLQLNFRSLLFREYLLLHGVCDVSKRTCLNLLNKGKSVFIAVGGATESLYAKPAANDLVLARRKGFVKVALRTGASLVPVYAFGENATFRTANELPSNSRLRRLQRKLTQLTGFTVPLYFGTGLFLPVGFLPFPVPLDVVVGAPLPVEKYQGDEASAEFGALVDRYHCLYVDALRGLFDAHKERFAKGETDLQLVE